jgi:Uma2 family endonuclease
MMDAADFERVVNASDPEADENDFEPDICFFKKEIADKFEPNQMIFPAPNFIIEVTSPSTEKIDRGVKFRDYEAAGVGEYWIVDPAKNTVEQYLNSDDGYELQENDLVIRSKEIEGFELDLESFFK